MQTNLIETLAPIGQVTQADNLAKKRGMYVDFEGGVIYRPTDTAPREAKKAVAVLRNAISSMPVLTDTGYHQYLLTSGDDLGRAVLAALGDRLAGMIKSDAEPTHAELGAFIDEMRSALESAYGSDSQLLATSAEGVTPA